MKKEAVWERKEKVNFVVTLHLEVCFIYCYFTWMFDLHCAEWCMCTRLFSPSATEGGKFPGARLPLRRAQGTSMMLIGQPWSIMQIVLERVTPETWGAHTPRTELSVEHAPSRDVLTNKSNGNEEAVCDCRSTSDSAELFSGSGLTAEAHSRHSLHIQGILL